MIQSQLPTTKATLAGAPVREAIAIVWRHRRLSLGAFVLVMVATVAVTVLMPKAYRSEAKLFLRLGRETATLDPTAMSNPESPTPMPMPESREAELNSAAEVIQSRGILERVVDALSAEVVLGKVPTPSASPAAPASVAPASAAPRETASSGWVERARGWIGYQSLAPRDKAVRVMAERLSVTPVRRSNIITLTYDAPSPETAQAVTARIVEFYRSEHLRLNRTEKAPEFLARETNRLREELEAAEVKLRDLKNATGVTSLDSHRQLLVTQSGRLDDSLLQTRALLSSSQAKVRELEEALAKIPAEEVMNEVSGKTSEGIENMHGQLYALKLREQQYASKYQETHPLLIEVRRQAAEAERILGKEERMHKEITTAPSRARQQVEAALLQERPVMVALQAQSTTLEQQRVDLQVRLKEVNENEMRIAGLQREIQLMETNYKRHAANLEQARIDQSLENQRISSVSVAQPATFEPRPIRPKVPVNLALGLVAGLAAAVGLAFVREYFTRTMNTAADVESYLHVPVLASIPKWKEDQELSTHART